MKTKLFCALSFFISLSCCSQAIQTSAEADLIKKIVDQQTNLKSFVIAPTIFNNRGQTAPGKFSYQFIYDSTETALAKVEVTELANQQLQSWYFRNDQLVLITSPKETVYFFDQDFTIPFWGLVPDKQSLRKDKYKETAYRFLVTFKKHIYKQ